MRHAYIGIFGMVVGLPAKLIQDFKQRYTIYYMPSENF